jgi:hypothetical protein
MGDKLCFGDALLASNLRKQHETSYHAVTKRFLFHKIYKFLNGDPLMIILKHIIGFLSENELCSIEYIRSICMLKFMNL